MDTQWTRWEVFEQEQAGGPYRNTGSVHAPDAEMALENARDVFVRRPRCTGLWVVEAQAILSRTAQELETTSQPLAPVVAGSLTETYLVFQKQSQRSTDTFVTHIGQVEAHTAEEALALAREKLGGQEAFVWWVCPAQAVVKTEDLDAAPMFAPAESKPYRHPQYYKVVTQLREIKSSKS